MRFEEHPTEEMELAECRARLEALRAAAPKTKNLRTLIDLEAALLDRIAGERLVGAAEPRLAKFPGLLERARAILSGFWLRQGARCDAWPVWRREPATSLRIACRFGPRLLRDVAYDATIVSLDEAPSLVVLDAEAAGGAARLPGVPCVLIDMGARAPRLDLADQADRVFAATPERAGAYAGGAAPVELIRPWVQPALFNPFTPVRRRRRVRRIPFATLGSVAPRDWRWVDALALGPVGDDPAVIAQVLEAAASGAVPLHPGVLALGHPLGGIAMECLNVAATAEDLQADPQYREGHVLRARRRILRDFTLAERLHQIAAAVGVASGWNPWPLVTVFIPTRRPQYLDKCMEQFRRQTWPNKELIITLHTAAVDSDQIARLQHANPAVRILCIAEERSVGECMNVAIDLARGAHCVKMDDDDWYGDEYVMDMMLNLRAVDADIYGKPPGFIYFETADAVFRRPDMDRQLSVIDVADFAANRVRISGATLSGRTAVLRAIGFSPRNRGASDTAFHLATAGRNLTICAFDGWSTVVFRGADPSEHTWRLSADSITDRSLCVGQGRAAVADLL